MSIIANSFIGSLTCSSREFTHLHRVFIGFQLIESSSSSDFNSSHLIVTHRLIVTHLIVGFISSRLIEVLISSHLISSSFHDSSRLISSWVSSHRDSSSYSFHLISSHLHPVKNSSRLIEHFFLKTEAHQIVHFKISKA